MKKLLITAIAAMGLTFAGCDMNESALISTANTAGNLTVLTWFSIDNPDCEVKGVIKEIVTEIVSTSVSVSEGATYLESVLPSVQAIAMKQDKLNDYQKTLINSGAVLILNGIDTFLASNEKVKANAELVSKVVASFGKGCMVVLNMGDDCSDVKKARAVYEIRSAKCRGGVFVMEQK